MNLIERESLCYVTFTSASSGTPMSYCQPPRTCHDTESKPFDEEKTYVFPGENIVIVCVVRFHCGDLRYPSSFTVEDAGRFYDTFRQNIMSVTFTSASTRLVRMACGNGLTYDELYG